MASLPTGGYLLIRFLPRHVLVVIVPMDSSENFSSFSFSFSLLFVRVLDRVQVMLVTRKRKVVSSIFGWRYPPCSKVPHPRSLSVSKNMLAPPRKRFVDLSHLLAESGLSYCTGHPRFNSEQVLSLHKDGTNVSRLIIGSHTGTHLDAPVHFLEGAPTISDVDLSTLVGPAVVVDVRGKEFHGGITWDDIGPQSEQLGPETILLFCTGWSRYWGREDYMKCPHLTEDAARKIIERGVRIVGIDVFDIDGYIPDAVGVQKHAIHRLLLGSGVLIAENLTNVEVLLDGSTYIVSLLPLNLEGCDGSPIRAIAWSG